MVVYDVQKLIEASAPDTVYLIFDREGNRYSEKVDDKNWYKSVDRFAWERETVAGKHHLRPLVKIYLV